ncbi:telomere zinc finger-associated protein isoform X2 [Monodon monoceros]|uniref:telomere zinc finger-associated protein isoform X2 n=1 Tax=Monodon monoceros TaxID=40151 RepID=UPI0010F438E6|nr:telomere zinc finger-associated protein isoform X2 [Monodon monoceros]
MDGSFVQHSVRVLQELNKQRERGQYCDATLDVGGLVFKAHWSVLACCSHFFQSLYGDGSGGSVVLPAGFAEIFGLLLDFFYTGHLALTSGNRDQVLLAARELRVPEAVELCQSFKPKASVGQAPSGQSGLGKPAPRDVNSHLKEPASLQEEEVSRTLGQTPRDQELSGSPSLQRPQLGLPPQSENPSFLRGKLKQALKLSHPENKEPEDCRVPPRPFEAEGVQLQGGSNEWEVVVQVEDDGDGDYVSETETVPTRRKSNVIRKPCAAEPALSAGSRAAEPAENRKGTAVPVECPTCHKKFLSKYYLKVHNRVSRREEGFWAHPCSFTSCVWPSLVESLRRRPKSSLPLPRSTALSAEETHWGETLRVSQMREMLLSEGEPPGARSPELHEPLGTGGGDTGPKGRRHKPRRDFVGGLHVLRVPGDIPPEDGAAAAHGVSHGGDALQGQVWLVPRAGGRGAAPGALPPSPLPGMVLGGLPLTSRRGALPSLPVSPCPRVPCPVLPHLWAGLLFLSAEGSLSLGMGVAPEALPSVAFMPGREHLGLCPALGFPPWQPGGLRRLRPVFQCASCSQQFMQKKDLQSHMIKLHGAPKPHACPTCAKCFLSRTELQLHEAFKHRGEKLFVCEECGHRASSRNGLQMHIKAKHRNERPYVCEFCSHAFTQKANLNMHLRTHTGEKPFQCHLCGKTFRTQASLDKHNRTHTGERPFSCEFCEQRFTEKGPLLRHVASRHQEGRPHFCQICGKTFKAVEQLRVHVRRHKGVRKFECTECGYKFTRQAHLRRHMEIHDRVENYNPRQRKLRNLVIEDEKMVVVALQPPTELEVGSAEVIVESLAQGGLASQLPGQRLCAEETFSGPGVMEPSLIITAAIPEDCDT